jgi:dephospho-CoA kinase
VALRVFGLTGGIGSGKSAVAGHWRGRGLPVVNADELARAVVLPGSNTLSQIVDCFGAGVVNAGGELDRAKLGAIVFSNAEARRSLDAIVHPAVRKLAGERFSELNQLGEPLACYEVPLLYETGLEQTYSPVVVVNAPEELRRPRLAARDGLDQQQIEARIAAQMPLSEKVRRADCVIENDASLASLYERSDAVLDRLCHALAIAPERYPKPAVN